MKKKLFSFLVNYVLIPAATALGKKVVDALDDARTNDQDSGG